MKAKEYTAHCEWDDSGWWVVTVPEVPGAVTQCRRLDQVPGDVGEVIKLLTGETARDHELAVEANFPGPAGKAAARANALRARSEEMAAEAHEASASAVRALRGAGLTFRDIGALVGVSHQRAQQIAEECRQTGAGQKVPTVRRRGTRSRTPARTTTSASGRRR